MARPPKLSDHQWNDLLNRLMAGEKAADLAREFGVSKGLVSIRVSKRAETIREVVTKVVKADEALKSLPVSDQYAAVTLIDELKAVSRHLAAAAKYGAANAHRLNAIAAGQLAKVDDVDPLASTDSLRMVGALTDLANKASTIGVNLLAANKETVKRINEAPPEESVTVDEYLAARTRVLTEF